MLKDSKLQYCKIAIGKLQCCGIVTCSTARKQASVFEDSYRQVTVLQDSTALH